MGKFFTNLSVNPKDVQTLKDLIPYSIDKDEEFQEYHQYALDLMELLQDHMPRLLKNEEFFRNVFYPNAG